MGKIGEEKGIRKRRRRTEGMTQGEIESSRIAGHRRGKGHVM
jgi:hypothetical protein